MNEISLASLRSRLVAPTLVLLATAATGKCPGPQHPPKSAEMLVHNLQDALFRSTWDYSVDGRRAVDAYWKSTELGSLKSLDAGFYDQLRVLYADVGGNRVVRARTRGESDFSPTTDRRRYREYPCSGDSDVPATRSRRDSVLRARDALGNAWSVSRGSLVSWSLPREGDSHG